MTATLSVLICTYGRPQMLERCLSSLIERTSEKPDQVIVVNGGDDRSDQVVNQYACKRGTEVTLVKTVNKNLAASRNVGLPRCAGEIVAMTDDDAEVFPDWVSQMKCVHAEHPDAGAVGGLVIGAETDSFISCIADQVTFVAYPTARLVRTLPGVNISYKRKTIQQVGKQDEKLFRGEDVDYNWRARKLGWAIYYAPSVRVLHHHRLTLRGFLHQHYMYGRAYYLVRRKWPEMYCVYPHGIHTARDLIKVLNFGLGTVYEPLPRAAHLASWHERIVAYPLLMLNEITWRSGMIRQACLNDET